MLDALVPRHKLVETLRNRGCRTVTKLILCSSNVRVSERYISRLFRQVLNSSHFAQAFRNHLHQFAQGGQGRCAEVVNKEPLGLVERRYDTTDDVTDIGIVTF